MKYRPTSNFVYAMLGIAGLIFMAWSVTSHAEEIDEQALFIATCTIVHEHQRDYDKAETWRAIADYLDMNDGTFWRAYKIARTIIDDGVDNNNLDASDFKTAEETCDAAMAELLAALAEEET